MMKVDDTVIKVDSVDDKNKWHSDKSRWYSLLNVDDIEDKSRQYGGIREKYMIYDKNRWYRL